MCLVLGPFGVGKTLLIKQLQSCSVKGQWKDLEAVPATIPTVGTNLVSIAIGKKTDVTLRELGGSMVPIWPTYYKDNPAVMFVIDTSNRQQVAAATIQLLEILTDTQLQSSSILVILNKSDVPGSMNRIELQELMRLDDIVRHCKQHVEILDCAKDSGVGLQNIMAWIQRSVKPSGPSSS